ncbi:hypothetical protein Gogos_020020, partial [Gossypium gossypioides]|nr:hypothetical protein [Gossypium gossypioides]
MHPLEKFTGFDLCTSVYEEKGRRLRLEYLRVDHFPKVLRHIDDTVLDLFGRLDKKVMPVLTSL